MAEYFGPMLLHTPDEHQVHKLRLLEYDQLLDETLPYEDDLIDWMMSGATNAWQRILDHLHLPYLSYGTWLSAGCIDPRIAAKKSVNPLYGPDLADIVHFDSQAVEPQSTSEWLEKMLPHRLGPDGTNNGDDCCSYLGTMVEYCFEQPYVPPVELFSLFPNLPPQLASLEALQGYHYSFPLQHPVLPFEISS